MGLDKYLKKNKIDKVIDPGGGESPNAILLNTPDIPKVDLDMREVTETPVSVLVDDLIIYSKQVQEEIQINISEIVNVNISDTIFKEYYNKVKEAYKDPKVIINTKTPSDTVSPLEIKNLERQIYRNATDPRAPFVQDLYNHLSDAASLEVILDTYWKKIVVPGDVYPSFQNNNLVKFSLTKDRQYLDFLRQSNSRIKRNTVQRLSNGFMNAFSRRIVNSISFSTSKEALSSVNKAISALKSVRSIVYVTEIFNTENWERFYTNISDSFSDILQSLGAKASKVSAYSFICGVQEDVLSFLDDLENFLPLDEAVQEIPEINEFQNQISSTFAKFISQIEEDLVYKEGYYAKMKENRDMLYSNSQKNSKTKQYLFIIDSAIQYLEQIRYTLSNLSSLFSLDVEILTQSLTNSADEYIRSINYDFKAKN